ncbi:homophilic cell adhesion via plasma membrane adhesion molecules [Sparganum proliferum]
MLSATDADEGPRGKVTYSIISGNEEGHFDLDEQTGWLYISKPFHQELLDEGNRSNSGSRLSGVSSLYENRLRILSLKTFRLYLRASDGGEPVRSTTAVLDIRLSRPRTLGINVPPSPQKLTNSALQKPLLSSAHASPREDHRLAAAAVAPPPQTPPSHALLSPGGQQSKTSLAARPIESEDRFGSSESLIVIAVMVAAVAALLFIVIILATACVRKRLYAGSGFTSAASPTLGGDHLQQGAHVMRQQKVAGKNFELRFPSLEASPLEGTGATEPAASKQVLSACMQLPVDHNSTYVTVTRNSLQRNNGGLSIRGGLTATYGVHSLEDLNGAPNEVINSYRLAKDANTPCGFFFQAPTSGVLTVGLSETQLREGSDGESASLCRPAVQASAGETRMTDQLTRRAEKLADCELLAEKNQTSAPATGLAISSHSNARSVSATPANAAYEQLLMSQQLREHGSAPPEDCVVMDSCIPLIPTNANVKVELPSSAQKEGKSLGPLFIKFQPRPDYLIGQPESRTYTALKFIQESAPTTRAEADATTANQESSFV